MGLIGSETFFVVDADAFLLGGPGGPLVVTLDEGMRMIREGQHGARELADTDRSKAVWRSFPIPHWGLERRKEPGRRRCYQQEAVPTAWRVSPGGDCVLMHGRDAAGNPAGRAQVCSGLGGGYDWVLFRGLSPLAVARGNERDEGAARRAAEAAMAARGWTFREPPLFVSTAGIPAAFEKAARDMAARKARVAAALSALPAGYRIAARRDIWVHTIIAGDHFWIAEKSGKGLAGEQLLEEIGTALEPHIGSLYLFREARRFAEHVADEAAVRDVLLGMGAAQARERGAWRERFAVPPYLTSSQYRKLAWDAESRGEYMAAANLYEAALAVYPETGGRLAADDQAKMARRIKELRGMAGLIGIEDFLDSATRGASFAGQQRMFAAGRADYLDVGDVLGKLRAAGGRAAAAVRGWLLDVQRTTEAGGNAPRAVSGGVVGGLAGALLAAGLASPAAAALAGAVAVALATGHADVLLDRLNALFAEPPQDGAPLWRFAPRRAKVRRS